MHDPLHNKSTMKDYNQNMCRILVVDDEPDIRELLDSYLSADGYDVVTA